eukprot:705303-Hanusia_phi.AAC.1
MITESLSRRPGSGRAPGESSPTRSDDRTGPGGFTSLSLAAACRYATVPVTGPASRAGPRRLNPGKFSDPVRFLAAPPGPARGQLAARPRGGPPGALSKFSILKPTRLTSNSKLIPRLIKAKA